MSKVLIVSYIFPPNTTIVSSFRPYSWYLEFEKHGLTPIVVTRHWTSEPILNSDQLGDEDLSPVRKINEGNKMIYYLPYKNNFFESNLRKTKKGPFLKFWELAGLITGNFTKEADLYYSFIDNIKSIIVNEKPAVLIFTAMPLSAVKLAYHLKKEFGIPIIIDFRDYWNNNLLNDSFNFTSRAKFSFFIQEKFIKKWLSNADAVLSVSQPILDKLAGFTSAKQILIHNGYEADLFKDIKVQPSGRFVISMVGMLYLTQNIDFVAKGFNEFLRLANNPTDVIIEFIGQDYLTEVSRKLKEVIPSQNFITTPRVPRNEALSKMKSAQVLYYAGWKGWKGIYSGKIFEYLGANRNILIAPGDGDVIDDLILETQSGIIANTIEDFAGQLLKWYNEWKLKGDLTYFGIPNKIEEYTREALAKKLAEQIHSIIRNTSV